MDLFQAVTLAEYTTWANHRILLKVARLPMPELTAEAALSHKTILGTVVHLLNTQWYWREGAQTGNLPMSTLAPADFPNPASLRERWAEEDRLLLEYVK